MDSYHPPSCLGKLIWQIIQEVIMQEWIISIMQQFGYLGVFLLIVLENIFPPIPSEVILSFGGFMTHYTEMSIIIVILVATLGSVSGALILYQLGKKLNNQAIRNIIGKYGTILGLTMNDMERTTRFYKKYENKTVFFGRMVPVVRSLISIPAGMAGMNLSQFILLTAAGSLIWNTLLVGAGALLGHAWGDILHIVNTYSTITYIVLTAGAIILAIFLLKKKAGKK